MGEQTVFTSGVLIRRGQNTKGTNNTVSNGSVIHVYDNQFMMLVDGGKVVDYTAEPGYYKVDNSSLPSMLNGELGESVKETFNRIKYGGQTPTAVVMQSATEENQIPVVFSAVSDPVGAGLAADVNAPGSNITGTSDAIDTAAIFDLMLAANPDTAKVGLLYDKSQASSLGAIEDAKAYCDEKGIAYVEKTGTTSAEVQAAADALVAEGVDAVFTPQDNTVMTAELSIFEKFIDAGIPHYTGADSFALNGAFCGYGVNYEELGTKTADMAVDILVNGADPAATPIETLERGIVTVNTETAEALGLDYSMFKDMCSEVIETVTAEEFE